MKSYFGTNIFIKKYIIPWSAKASKGEIKTSVIKILVPQGFQRKSRKNSFNCNYEKIKNISKGEKIVDEL